MARGERRRAGRRAARHHGAHRVRRPPARSSCPAACASGSPSPGRSRPSPTCCCSTSRSARSTRSTKRAMQDFLLHGLAAHRRHDPDGHPRRRGGDLPRPAHLRAVAAPGPHRGRRSTCRSAPAAGPSVKRDPRFLDLRDEIEDLLQDAPDGIGHVSAERHRDHPRRPATTPAPRRPRRPNGSAGRCRRVMPGRALARDGRGGQLRHSGAAARGAPDAARPRRRHVGATARVQPSSAAPSGSTWPTR